jgi:hypothetical protein
LTFEKTPLFYLVHAFFFLAQVNYQFRLQSPPTGLGLVADLRSHSDEGQIQVPAAPCCEED